jgi:aryl-alcohol dehydrogenase-like predicted oxidoreductase
MEFLWEIRKAGLSRERFEMEYREHKGLKFSEIGIGCYALSGVYGKKNEQFFKQKVKRAFELGVTFFDAAEGYGPAEQILGEAVKPFRRELIISTKVGVKKGAKPNLSADYIQAACRESLKALDTDYIDIYHIHYDDPQWEVEEVVGALEDLVREGLIRHYGLDHISMDRLKAYLEQGRIFSILMELSAVERNSLKEILPVCREEGIAGIAFSVTGRGLLTGKYRDARNFNHDDFRRSDPLFQRERFRSGLRITKMLEIIGRKYGKTPVQAAIAWVLHQPGIFCALTGPSSIEHLEENLGGCGWEFESEDLEELELFLSNEQYSLEAEQRLSIKNILTSELDHNPNQAFTDLVYVLETAFCLGIASEAQLMPVFYELFALKGQLSESVALQKMIPIQRQVKEILMNRDDLVYE